MPSPFSVLLGAQVWLAPGEYDRPEQLDRLFAVLAEHDLPLARVSLVRNHLEPAAGRWDFALYDAAFDAAVRHGVRITATLWPQAAAPALSGVPDTPAALAAGEPYLDAVVPRYAAHPALDSWILMNEPGQPPAVTELAELRFRDWLCERYGGLDELNRAWFGASMLSFRAPYASFDEVTVDPRWSHAGLWPVPGLDWLEFWRAHLTWYLGWVAERVRRLDPAHPLHTNPHGVSRNLATRSLDLPSWRPHLDSLGASIYPMSLTEFGPDRLTLGHAFCVDLLHGAMAGGQVWATELAAGPAIRSHATGYAVEPRELAQRVWTVLGAGAERAVLWLLNARWRSREPGEFALLDYRGEPTERLRILGSIGRLLAEHDDLFTAAEPVTADVTLVLSVESMALDHQWAAGGDPARGKDAHLLEALGWYEALQSLGTPPRVVHIADVDWSPEGPPRLIVLPHVEVLSEEQAATVGAFVLAGHTVLASGLAGWYDRDGRFWPLADEFPLGPVVGGRPRELRVVDGGRLALPTGDVPAGTWLTDIEVGDGNPLAKDGDTVTALMHDGDGGGRAVWLPALVGLAAFTGDGAPLARYTATVVEPFVARLPVRIRDGVTSLLVRTLRGDGDRYVTVVANPGGGVHTVTLDGPDGVRPDVLWGDPDAVDGSIVTVGAHDTVVVAWR